MDTNAEKLPVVVGIRFSPIGKSYFFDASNQENLRMGDNIVVETSRGWQLGQIVQIVEDEEIRSKIRYKPIDRLATADDLKKKDHLDKKAVEALDFTRKIVDKKKDGLKVISAEYSFDESTLTFLYSTENDNQVDFKSASKDVREKFHLKKVDFHKIGPRDVAKYLCGMGACGLESRCCSQFLCNFESISIRMAKTQGISLTPSDITGMCNRLRCCLSYEYCNYVEALKGLPKKNKRVNTPMGPGKVRDVAPLSKTVFVKLDDLGVKEFNIEEIEAISQSTPAQAPNENQKTDSKNAPRPNKKNFQNRRKRNTGPKKESGK